MDSFIRDMPEGFGRLEYKDLTNIHPLAFFALIVLGIAMLVISRRWAILPMLIIACFISSVQKIAVLGLDFNLLRIMILFGTARLILRRDYVVFSWGSLDTVMVLWIISSILIHTLQQGSFSAFVNRLGFGFDAFGMYFLFRCLVQDWIDVNHIILAFILISIPVALLFLVENRTGRNIFSVFGGVPEITIVRAGRLRCQGAFPHPIIAGCFWASLMPLFAAYWWKSKKDKAWAIAGLTTSSIIVICCASSTPLMGVLCGIIGGLMFYFRRHMRLVRWGILLSIIALHMVMQAPVWHLIARISAVGGSTSYFRYLMVDQATKHFHEWALLGTKSTAHWFWGAQDITNHYVLEGVQGGALTLFFFIYLIALAFRGVGLLSKTHKHDTYLLILSWTLGVSVFIHCVQFIGVSYTSGGILVVWYLPLAMIGSLTQGIVTNENCQRYAKCVRRQESVIRHRQ